MKKTLFLFLIVIIFNSCQEKLFFSNFDKVEYYHLANKTMLNYETRDSLSDKIIVEDYPNTLNDDVFYERLKLNFSVKSFTTPDIEVFKKLFNKNIFTDVYTTACIPEYKDVLILKKKNKIVGIIKICLRCEMHYIIGKNEENKKITKSGGIENSEIETLLKKYN